MQASNNTNQSYRMAQRTFHCYACDRQFKQMTNVEDYSDVRCTHCQSDFFEEAKYVEQERSQSPPQSQNQSQQSFAHQ